MANEKHIGATEGPFLPPPETPEEVDAFLRAHGYDPDKVGAKMQAIVDHYFSEEREQIMAKTFDNFTIEEQQFINELTSLTAAEIMEASRKISLAFDVWPKQKLIKSWFGDGQVAKKV